MNEVYSVVIGWVLGSAGGVVAWLIAKHDENKRQLRQEIILLMKLGYEVTRAGRSLLYAKKAGLEEVAAVADPLGELFAISQMSFDEFGETIQALHDAYQAIHFEPAMTLDGDRAEELLAELNRISNELNRKAVAYAVKQGVAKGPIRELRSSIGKG